MTEPRLYNEYGQLLGAHDRRLDAKYAHVADYDVLAAKFAVAVGLLREIGNWYDDDQYADFKRRVKAALKEQP